MGDTFPLSPISFLNISKEELPPERIELMERRIMDILCSSEDGSEELEWMQKEKEKTGCFIFSPTLNNAYSDLTQQNLEAKENRYIFPNRPNAALDTGNMNIMRERIGNRRIYLDIPSFQISILEDLPILQLPNSNTNGNKYSLFRERIISTNEYGEHNNNNNNYNNNNNNNSNNNPYIQPGLNIYSEDKGIYYYMDERQNIQGPYTPAQMFKWTLQGYFTSHLLVALGSNSMFLPLHLLFSHRY